MTASDTVVETWKPIPGARHYEACDHGGKVRSVPRWINGRSYPGTELTPKKTGTSPYWQVKITDDTGRQRTRAVHVLVLEAHRGLCPPGKQGCHADDDQDNNDLPNLRWDWPEGNREDRRRNSPPAPKPAKVCVRCEGEFAGNGRRCHPCVVGIGVEGAKLLRSGVSLEDAARQLGYPSLDGLHTLARRHGGYGRPWWHRVKARWLSWLAGGDAP